MRGTRGGSCDFNLDCSGHARGNGGDICSAYTTHRTVDGSNVRSDNGEGSLLERNEASEEALKHSGEIVTKVFNTDRTQSNASVQDALIYNIAACTDCFQSTYRGDTQFIQY